MDYYGYNDYRNYHLAHHGVVGMHWGIRRYQPYGIGYQRIGGKKGVEKLSKRDRESLHASQKARELAIARIRKQPIDKETGLPLKTKKWSVNQDVKAVNPGFSPLSEGTCMNCMYCTTTFELRRRGYDVCAKLNAKGEKLARLFDWFEGKRVEDFTLVSPMLGPFRIPFSPRNKRRAANGENTEMAKACEREMLKQGEGARVALCMSWAKDASHIVNYEIKGGKVIVMDCQSGEQWDSPEEILRYACDASFIRLDDLQINKKRIKEVVA